MALEIHVPLPFASSAAHVVALGRLAAMMSAAGLELASVELDSCAPPDEAPGCHAVRRAALSLDEHLPTDGVGGSLLQHAYTCTCQQMV